MCLSILFYVTCITRIRFLPPSTCTIISLWNKKKKRICNIQFISYNLFFDTFYSPSLAHIKTFVAWKISLYQFKYRSWPLFDIFLFGYDVMIMMYLDLSRCITSISAKLTDDSAQMSSKYGYEILSEFIFSYTFFIS